MSDYAVKNLMEIEDAAGDRPQEARFSRKYLGSDTLGISHFRYPPGFRATDGHHHEVQEEAYVVIAGGGRIRLDDEVVDLHLWDVVRVAPAVVRGFEADDEGLEIIAVGGPKPEGGDGVLDAGRWAEEPGS
jgi:mannose-6-phosphate isomerase-like protein (cupin superfamily)